MPKTINDLLSSWGASKRQLPSRNEVLKSETLKRLNRLPELSGSTAKLRLPWLSFAFASLAVIMLIVDVAPPALPTPVPMAGEVQTLSQRAIAPDYYPYPGPGGDITDTREFLKTGYNAAIRTRHISDQSQTIRNIIRGVDGRVDSMNISEKTGYVSFAIPASKFDAFQSQIKGLVGAKFIIETINTQNLLPQKQSIEEAQQQISAKLSSVRSQRGSLIAAHNRTIASLQIQLQQVQSDEERAQINAQIANENASYSRQLASLNAQITEYQSALDSTNKQDQQLLNNVATVNGSISLEWISIWDIINLYAGPYWLPILLALAAVAAYWNHRRHQQLILPF